MTSTDLVMLKGEVSQKRKLEQIVFHPTTLILLVGFLLGRAYILGEITPFALPFIAVVFMVKRERTGIALLVVLLGGLTSSLQTAIYLLMSILFFLLTHLIFVKLAEKMHGLLPIQVLLSTLLSHLGIVFLYTQTITFYDLTIGLIEGALSYVITIIFLQSIPIVFQGQKKRVLETEEIVCLIIFVASIITGTNDLFIYKIAVQAVLANYLLLMFTYVTGATIGATVGVVTGMIISLANGSNLSQISMLAFSGLLSGLLKEGKKLGVSFGLLVGTSLISLYSEQRGNIENILLGTGIAILLFLLTPKGLMDRLAKITPGTAEHSREEQQYLRKLRDVTAEKILRFSSVFDALATSFVTDKKEGGDIDLFLSGVAEKTCQRCSGKEKCWVENTEKTYDLMKGIVKGTEQGKLSDTLTATFAKSCHKSAQVVRAVEEGWANNQLKKQMIESRKLVAEQLTGVAKVMENFAKEIQKEKENHQFQESKILTAIRDFGVEINRVDIYSLEGGDVDIEVSIPFCNGSGACEKIIAPMLSDILQENIIVVDEEHGKDMTDCCTAFFGSAKKYTIEIGFATVAKGGDLLSGDSSTAVELGAGKFAIAISDGMGNGERAHLESTETLKLLKKILQSGIEETIAIKAINSILSLRTTDEMYATLDLAMIDLQNLAVKFLKVGATPSFIKRGNQVIKVEGSNLPIGIIADFDVSTIEDKLKVGDLLIMMTDGVYEGVEYVENHDIWLKRKISQLQTNEPSEVADILLEEVLRTKDVLEDDMTLVVGRVDDNVPKWATIPV